MAEKECIFLAIRYYGKCTGKSNAEKKSRKGLIAKMTMCWATNGIVIRTRYEKGEEPKGGGGGRREA